MLHHKRNEDVMNNKLIHKQQNLISALLFFSIFPLLFLVEGQSFPESSSKNNEIISAEINEVAPKLINPVNEIKELTETNYSENEKLTSIIKSHWKQPFNYRKGDYCNIRISEENLEIINIFCNTGAILSRSVQKSYEKSLNKIEKSYFNGNYYIVFPDKGHDA